MKNKFLTFILIFLLFFSLATSSFAEDDVVLLSSAENTDALDELLEDSLENDTEDETSYIINDEVSGNVFKGSSNFAISETGKVLGNIYIVAETVFLKSDVTYSDALAKDGEYSIDTINSAAKINGNAFVVCKNFILESGAEINGDLYIVAQNIDLKKSASISGNLFAASNSLNLNCRIGNSVYASADNFTSGYYGSIAQDLNLSSEEATLNSVIHKSVNISADSLTTSPDFLLYGDLDVSASSFKFSGEVDGNATISAKDINFESNDAKCIIMGDLNYSTPAELEVSSDNVQGAINYSAYIKGNNTKKLSTTIRNWFISLLSLFSYVFIVILTAKFLAPNYSKEVRSISLSNIFASLGIGLLSIILVFIGFILLLMIPFGVTLSFALLFAYIFTCFMAIPLFILDIANLLKEKMNFYLATLLVALVLFIISKLPFIGGLIFFLFVITGIGRLFKTILFKKK